VVELLKAEQLRHVLEIVGATDFTLEFWLRALAAENPAPAVACGANNNWIYGNIVVDLDRFNQDRAFDRSLAGGIVVFGVDGAGTGSLTPSPMDARSSLAAMPLKHEMIVTSPRGKELQVEKDSGRVKSQPRCKSVLP
jgi:hypothetical protein